MAGRVLSPVDRLSLLDASSTIGNDRPAPQWTSDLGTSLLRVFIRTAGGGRVPCRLNFQAPKKLNEKM
jgi:hypothetical protein